MSWIVQSRRLAVFSMVASCQAPPPPLQSQTPLAAAVDSLRLVLRWGSLDSASTAAGPAREIRWNWNGTIIRLDTVTGFADSVVVPIPSEGEPDTVVVAVWPLGPGPPLLRHLTILDARALARRHGGHLAPTLVFDHRREDARAGTRPASDVALGSRTEIQRWDMNDWSITGSGGTTRWTDGGGNTPGWPHQLVGGLYRLDYPVTQYSSWLGWNFVNQQQFGSVTVDVDFRMNQPICVNTKGIRFDEGTNQWPGGHAWEGLYLNPTGGGSCGFTMSFSISPYAHHTGAYFTSNGPTAGNGLVVVNNLADDQWHHFKLTYDVSQPQKRMQLFVDGTLVAQPDGPSLQGSGFDGGCNGSAGPGAFWQNGWLVTCNTRAENLIGSGRLLDINKAGQAAGTVLELDNWVWSN